MLARSPDKETCVVAAARWLAAPVLHYYAQHKGIVFKLSRKGVQRMEAADPQSRLRMAQAFVEEKQGLASLADIRDMLDEVEELDELEALAAEEADGEE
jgi:hypothetical protein